MVGQVPTVATRITSRRRTFPIRIYVAVRIFDSDTCQLRGKLVRKRVLFAAVYTKSTFLPRQARDKHRKS
jgi:hypothetical protein